MTSKYSSWNGRCGYCVAVKELKGGLRDCLHQVIWSPLMSEPQISHLSATSKSHRIIRPAATPISSTRWPCSNAYPESARMLRMASTCRRPDSSHGSIVFPYPSQSFSGGLGSPGGPTSLGGAFFGITYAYDDRRCGKK